MEALCPACGMPLDEIPFAPCATHDAEMRKAAPLSIEEVIEVASDDYLRISMERTGDD